MKSFILKLALPVMAFALTAFSASAQSTEVTTEETVKGLTFAQADHNFGKIAEKGSPASCIFEFVNDSDAPITIMQVRPSCGCTIPDWTKEPVAPGKKGFVKATYNQNGRPGSFRKTLIVATNGEPKNIVLTISGEVIANAKPEDLKR